jgi:hypothetical protein
MDHGRRPLAVATVIEQRFGTLQVDRLALRFSKGTGPTSEIAQADLLALRNLSEVASHFAMVADELCSQRQTQRVGQRFAPRTEQPQDHRASVAIDFSSVTRLVNRLAPRLATMVDLPFEIAVDDRSALQPGIRNRFLRWR